MADHPRLTRLDFTPARTLDAQAGLLGFLVLELDDVLAVDGATLRRTTRGELRISMPSRTDAAGRRHPVLRPLRAAAWRLLEDQVLAELARQGVLP